MKGMLRIAGIGLVSMFMLATGVLAQEARPVGASQAPGRLPSWPTERAAMLKQAVDRAWSHVRAVRTMAEIGTMSAADVKASETWFADLEKQVAADAQIAASRRDPSPAERAALRIRFAEAMNAVDLAEIKFDNGMTTTAAMNATLGAAAAVILGPPVK
jgi:hypothetical protein